MKDFLQYKHDNGTIANEPLYWLWPENGTPETNLALIINNLTWYFSAFIEGDGDVPDAEEPWDVYRAIPLYGVAPSLNGPSSTAPVPADIPAQCEPWP